MGNLQLDCLPLDIIYEILGHLPVEDIIRTRRACRKMWQATRQRNVWFNVYQRSNLLLPEGPFPSQCATELESCIVHAAKLNYNWTSPRPSILCRRRFPRVLPSYDFDANVISGRYLQLAEKNCISWYDLDSNDMGKPILTYPCAIVSPMSGYLRHQINANGEGSDVVWVSFLNHTPRKICILKASFGESGPKVKLHAELQARNITSIQMGYDWILPISEFQSPNDLMDLIHIPSRSTLHLPAHSKVQNLSDLSNMNYAITPRFLFLMFSVRNATLVDVFPLPNFTDPIIRPSSGCLVRSHSGMYPHAMTTFQIVETSSDHPTGCSNAQSTTFLALVYVNNSPATWTSKIGLHLFDTTMDSFGALSFTTRCQTTLNVGIVTTSLSLSSRAGICFAVTHSSPGPVILGHIIQRHQNSECTMSVRTLKLPAGLSSREMLAFDGLRGRLCLITGWSYIDILDYAPPVMDH